MNNKLATLIANGEISVEELANANQLIERAKLAVDGVNACKKTLVFPIGCSSIDCYSYTDNAGEYSAWGSCTSSGVFQCWCNWGGNHKVGEVNLISFTEVFLALGEDEIDNNLERFLKSQIQIANQNTK